MNQALTQTAPEGYRQALHLSLTERASNWYRPAGRFAHGFAKGKLGRDPLFIDMLRHGVFPARGRFLDLGCGQAVFAAWLQAAQDEAQQGRWPANWPQPPQVDSLLGLELMPFDVARANEALGHLAPRVTIAQGDIHRQKNGRLILILQSHCALPRSIHSMGFVGVGHSGHQAAGLWRRYRFLRAAR